MKKILNKTNLLVAFLFALIACLTASAATLKLTVHAQEEKPTSVVTLTSYTSILNVDEDYQFAALVTNENDSTSTTVTWTSSNEAAVEIDSEGLAYANAEGTATITATATDGAYASIDVLVSDTAIRVASVEVYPTEIEMKVDWTTRLGYNVFPQNAYENSVFWTSSDTSVVTVNAEGYITSVAAGTATVTVTTRDNLKTAQCKVTVYADTALVKATLTPATLTMNLPQYTENEFTLDLPEGVELAAVPQWYTANDSIVSIDRVEDNRGTAFAWSFGSTTVYVVAHGTDGKVYYAMADVMVTSDFFYITGLESDISDPDENPWKTYATAAEAEAAGVLLAPDADNPGVYSLSREFWALDGFQIIHGNMDPDWTTRITPAWYDAADSTTEYVANTAEMFMFTELGEYCVELDLTDGPAKVSLKMVDLVVTSVDLYVAEGSEAYLQGEGNTMTLDVYTIPDGAAFDLSDVTVTVPGDMQEFVSAEPRLTSAGKLQIVLTLLKEYTEEVGGETVAVNTSFNLGLKVENGTDEITITILKDGEEYVPVSSLEFEGAPYTLNVNNGATEWRTPIRANVNADASVQDVAYYENYDQIYIEYDEDGQAYVHAAALGTFTIYATTLGGNADGDTITVETTVLVTSLVAPAEGSEDATSGFYLIGMLNGVEVGGWTSIKPDVTTFDGSEFADYVLRVVAGTKNTLYRSTFALRQHDRFSIAFLGMNGNWDGIINNQFFDWDASKGTYWENDINIEMSEDGRYTVTLDLSAEVPSFTIERVGDYSPEVIEYDLYLYIVRGGDAWNPNLSDEGNRLATVGYIHMVDGVAQSFTLTSDPVSLYGLPWPAVQFVTATGIVGGYFQDATWYGTGYTGLTFTGDWKPEDTEGETDYFTNSNDNSVLYWVGDYTMNVTDITVSFSFTFNDKGVLTNVDVTIVSVTERTETAE